MYRKVLEMRASVLGAEHPHTVASIIDHARYLCQHDKLAESELLFRKALDIRERLLGTTHPDTIQCAEDLGDCQVVARVTVLVQQGGGGGGRRKGRRGGRRRGRRGG